MIDIPTLIRQNGLVSDQVDADELTTVLLELEQTHGKEGAVVEFGCYVGTTSLYIRRVLNAYSDAREFHVYDSFEGLPEKSTEDLSPVGEQFKAGELSVSRKQFESEFKKARLQLPVIHKGWFSDLTPANIPDRIRFAFLDGDFYDSVKTPLKLIESVLTPGATIIVDDYANEALPGAARATDEWCRAKGLTVRVVHSLGVIHLP